MPAEATAPARRRRRLSPEHRRDQLLDCARVIIARRGLSSLTMEAIAVEAGVSNPLIYKYFDTRAELLQALLRREYDRHYNAIQDGLAQVSDYREAVRVFVEVNFEQVARGNVLNILRDQADVRVAIQDVLAERQQSSQQFLITGLMELYDVSQSQAEHLVAVGSSSAIAAAESFRRRGGDQQQMIDEIVRFIFGGIEAAVAPTRPGD